MNEKRVAYVDIAKSIGIILVVLGHTDFMFKNFIYQFHLPLFFFLSGYVFSDKYLNNFNIFLKKRIRSLYIPFITFQILFLLFHNLFCYFGFYNELSNTILKLSLSDLLINISKILTMGYGEQLAGPLWFLISLLEINFIFYILLKVLKKFSINRISFALIMFGLILYNIGCYIELPRMLSQSFIGLLFYILGYIYKKNENSIKLSFIYFIISIIFLLICTYFNTVDISKLIINYKFLLIISGLCGTYGILYISQKLSFLNKKIILYIGENTLYILALHCLVFKILMMFEIKIYNLNHNSLGIFPVYQVNQIWGIIFTFFGVLIPLFIKFLKEKTDKLLGGF